MHLQGCPSGCGTLFVDIKLNVPLLYKLLMPKLNSYFNVKKRLSSISWTTLYPHSFNCSLEREGVSRLRDLDLIQFGNLWLRLVNYSICNLRTPTLGKIDAIHTQIITKPVTRRLFITDFLAFFHLFIRIGRVSAGDMEQHYCADEAAVARPPLLLPALLGRYSVPS